MGICISDGASDRINYSIEIYCMSMHSLRLEQSFLHGLSENEPF